MSRSVTLLRLSACPISRRLPTSPLSRIPTSPLSQRLPTTTPHPPPWIRYQSQPTNPPPPSQKPPPKQPKLIPLAREQLLNVPNILTTSRLLSTPIIGYLILTSSYPSALTLFLLSGLTDLLDGHLARKYSLQTVAGSVLDPLADKVLMITLTTSLAAQGALPLSLAVLILGRDASLGLAAIWYRYASLPDPKTWRRYWDFGIPSAEVHPTAVSKGNTLLQLGLMGGVLVGAAFPGVVSPEVIGYGGAVVAVTTAYSGAEYAVRRDVVTILGNEGEKVKAWKGRVGRGVVGVLFSGVCALAVWVWEG
ncbi:hypothetical protein K470DRAFT_256444 [Piedraia hortae CBS 480.64]|uniref:CDP-alcohol phosphatidyltransferase n=1 Tax=Piedraia hortae CBS 480.64 TaxID=1314780 RepID=A0A6A7C3T7_9PEZI|nr:hypothetical protein K470DRAFT_256444 [Piedraia hortae CBS 480.64]